MLMPLQRVPMLMGIEGNIRQVYYDSFNIIVKDHCHGRQEGKQPPMNENATHQFLLGNMIGYTLCLDFRFTITQLNPPPLVFSMSPALGRYFLGIGLAEICKPLLEIELFLGNWNKKRCSQKIFISMWTKGVLKEIGAKKAFIRHYEGPIKWTI